MAMEQQGLMESPLRSTAHGEFGEGDEERHRWTGSTASSYNEQGELLALYLTPGNVDDRKPVPFPSNNRLVAPVSRS